MDTIHQFIAFITALPPNGDDGFLSPIHTNAGDQGDAVWAVGVEPAVKLGFHNSYLSQSLTLTEEQILLLLDYNDNGRLAIYDNTASGLKVKELLLWLKSFLQN